MVGKPGGRADAAMRNAAGRAGKPAARGIRAVERRLRLREALLAAAEAMIRMQGLGGLKARELAQAAGCAVGAIYNVFPDLDSLVLAVNAGTLDRIDAAIERAGREGDRAEGEGNRTEGPGGATGRLIAL